MTTDAKEYQQPQSTEERLARIEKTVNLLHERADNFDVILQAMKVLIDAHGGVLRYHKTVIEELRKSTPAPPTPPAPPTN